MKRGFTLIELLVVIAIIAILAAILFPVFAKAKEAGRRTTCQGNEKEMAAALFLYAESWQGYYPLCSFSSSQKWQYKWMSRLTKYLRGGSAVMASDGSYMMGASWFRCPSAPKYDINQPVSWTYAMATFPSAWNTEILEMYRMDSPCRGRRQILVGDGRGFLFRPTLRLKVDQDGDGVNDAYSNDLAYATGGGLSFYHNDGGNFCYGDGHIKWVSKKALFSSWDQMFSQFYTN